MKLKAKVEDHIVDARNMVEEQKLCAKCPYRENKNEKAIINRL